MRVSPMAGVYELCCRVLTFGFVLIAFLSSAYCVLAYIPTTYFAFIQAPFQSWMPFFARVQPWLFTFLFAGTLAEASKQVRVRRTRWLAFEFLFAGTLTAVYLLLCRPLLSLRNDSASFIWAVAFLLPVVCLGLLEYRSWLPELKRGAAEPRSVSYIRVVMAALMISVISPASAYLRYWMASTKDGSLPRTSPMAWIWAAATQICLFVFVFTLVELALQYANNSTPRRMPFLVYSAIWWIGGAVVFYKVILASIPFSGTDAAIYALLFSLAAVALLGGKLLRRSAHLVPSTTGMDSVNKLEGVGHWLLILAAPVTVPAFIGILDWNAVLEKTWSLVYWGIVITVIVYRRPAKFERRTWPLLLAATCTLLLFQLGAHSERNWGRLFPYNDLDPAVALEQQAAIDRSFLAASELMAPFDFRFCNRQCELIRENTNIPASAITGLHDVTLVQKLEPLAGSKPNVFIIVVDSLRQDYLSPYNAKVDFTPSIQAFADESVVFKNAFTRYGGTTLAEPSIWAGTLLLHKHYVQPFHLVNNLEKLTEIDGYQQFISTDTVLRVLLQPSADTVQLDADARQWTDLDFCSTAQEALNKISARRDPSRPIFLYTQPQNIHFVTLGKTVASRPATKNYAPFYSQYASELQRLDGCFGNFIHKLKSRGLYDNSIIVVTADHGEALDQIGGERHGFSLKPAVIRVPLIVHVPRKIKDSWYYDPSLISFNTDIAATVYEILGHGPVISRPEFGRPLFTPTRSDMDQYRRDSYMIASSYGPLYGVLTENGAKLFIEHEDSEELFDLAKDPEASRNLLTEETRKANEAQLRQDIEGIARIYGYTYRSPSLAEWLKR